MSVPLGQGSAFMRVTLLHLVRITVPCGVICCIVFSTKYVTALQMDGAVLLSHRIGLSNLKFLKLHCCLEIIIVRLINSASVLYCFDFSVRFALFLSLLYMSLKTGTF